VMLVFGVIFAMLGFGAMGLAAGGGAEAAAGMMGVIGLILLLLLPVLLWLAARFSVSLPAMADARSANPLYGLATSWRLTSASQWAIMGYIALLIVALVVVFMVYGMIVGLVAMIFGSTLGPLLSSILIGVPQAVLTVAIAVGIYKALVPHDSRDVFA